MKWNRINIILNWAWIKSLGLDETKLKNNNKKIKKSTQVDDKIHEEKLRENFGGWVPPKLSPIFPCNFIGYTYWQEQIERSRTKVPLSF